MGADGFAPRSAASAPSSAFVRSARQPRRRRVPPPKRRASSRAAAVPGSPPRPAMRSRPAPSPSWRMSAANTRTKCRCSGGPSSTQMPASRKHTCRRDPIRRDEVRCRFGILASSSRRPSQSQDHRSAGRRRRLGVDDQNVARVEVAVEQVVVEDHLADRVDADFCEGFACRGVSARSLLRRRRDSRVAAAIPAPPPRFPRQCRNSRSASPAAAPPRSPHDRSRPRRRRRPSPTAAPPQTVPGRGAAATRDDSPRRRRADAVVDALGPFQEVAHRRALDEVLDKDVLGGQRVPRRREAHVPHAPEVLAEAFEVFRLEAPVG